MNIGEKKDDKPTSAFLAVTFRCNSRCIMCNIWKKKNFDFLEAKIYKKLPSSLQTIDITGGEPFLRNDLVDIFKIIKETCPKAKILITTNGFISKRIYEFTSQMLKIDKNLAIRISLDGIGETHDKIRGINGVYQRVIKTIELLKKTKIYDLGIIFTLMKQNSKDLTKVLDLCKKEKLNFSLNLVYDSPVYFGKGHINLRPNFETIKENLSSVTNFFIPSFNLKDWAKAWFYQKLIDYAKNGKRPIRCGAGKNFFYVDPFGNVYMCHFKNWKIGNLKKQSFSKIWNSQERKKYLKITSRCHDCWMICTTKDEIKKLKWKILFK